MASELRELVALAQAGDPSALPRIREILDARPEVWQHVGDLAALAERAWVAVLAADNPLAAESMRRAAAEMRADLAGGRPTRLERLLVDEVVVRWMEAKYTECAAANPPGGSLAQAALRLKRQESAQRRYLAAMKALVSVRTLMPAGLAPSDSIRLYDQGKHKRA